MSDIETLEHDAVDCELHCPHGQDSREAKLEREFIAALNTMEDGMRKFAKSFGVDFDKTVSDAARNFQGSTIPQCPPLSDADIERLVDDDDKVLNDWPGYETGRHFLMHDYRK